MPLSTFLLINTHEMNRKTSLVHRSVVLTKILQKNPLTVCAKRRGGKSKLRDNGGGENDELPEATQREAELQRQIDDLQSQVTGLH